jgi:hypothetical protein
VHSIPRVLWTWLASSYVVYDTLNNRLQVGWNVETRD